MHRNRVAIVAMILALVAGSAFAVCNSFYLPDFNLSTVTIAHQGPESLSIMVVPDGSGDALDTALMFGGTHTDATITVMLMDPMGYALDNYCFDSIMLTANDGGVIFCTDTNYPDGDTDETGMTQFHGPFHGGGSSMAGLIVLVNHGGLLTAPLPLSINSPDLNGDLVVNLSDIPLFASDFYGSYAYRSDFHYDGIVNLSDLTRMAQSIGRGCP